MSARAKLPPKQPYSQRRPGQPVCRGCGRGYGSTFDGLCINCRGGVTGWEAAKNARC